MSKVDIKRLDSVTKNDTTATEQINDNFKALQAAIENTVSRDGTVPNYMDADLDLNSYRIINAAAPVEGKDVVTLEYFEEKAGGAIEAAAQAKASASKAASSAQSALVASNNAIGQLAQAEGLLTAAEGQLEDTKQYVNAAKADIEGTKNTAIETTNSTVSTAKADINSAIDEATMNISYIVSDAEGSITNIAVTEANKAIANAAQEATDAATANLNSYVDGTVKPSLQTYVDQSQADANSAATSMEQAALSATAASNYASNASADADNAAESATHAATSAADSEHYSEDSRIWAEGTDSEVQELGGVHSSKVWSETAQAVVDGKQDIATAVNYKNITNCITEIPQDIKLELNNGTLTLKAGSKVYVPNGFESNGTTPKFDVKVIESDVSTTNTSGGASSFVYYTPSPNTVDFSSISVTGSGTTPPSTGVYYNTSTNKINYWLDSSAKSDRSFPIAIVQRDSSGITSIDQVFNGFGYIGSTIFALPGVKGLIPNGRNADGSLKNIEVTLDDVKIQNRTDWGSVLRYFWLGSDGKLLSAIASNVTYDVEKNKNYNTTDNTSVGLICGEVTSVDGRITSIAPKTAFHALDYSDKSVISGWGMPSNRYINLTLGASGSSYTAPANGWFYVRLQMKNAYCYLEWSNQTTSAVQTENSYGGTPYKGTIFPVRKGDVVKLSYIQIDTSNTNNQIFRFIYAEGEN